MLSSKPSFESGVVHNESAISTMSMGVSGRVVFQPLNGDLAFFFSQEKAVANMATTTDQVAMASSSTQGKGKSATWSLCEEISLSEITNVLVVTCCSSRGSANQVAIGLTGISPVTVLSMERHPIRPEHRAGSSFFICDPLLTAPSVSWRWARLNPLIFLSIFGFVWKPTFP